MAGRPRERHVDAHGILPFYAGLVARAAAMDVRFAIEGDEVTITATPAASPAVIGAPEDRRRGFGTRPWREILKNEDAGRDGNASLTPRESSRLRETFSRVTSSAYGRLLREFLTVRAGSISTRLCCRNLFVRAGSEKRDYSAKHLPSRDTIKGTCGFSAFRGSKPWRTAAENPDGPLPRRAARHVGFVTCSADAGPAQAILADLESHRHRALGLG